MFATICFFFFFNDPAPTDIYSLPHPAPLPLSCFYRVAQPGTPPGSSFLPEPPAATILCWGVNSLFGIYVRKTQYGPVYGGLAAAIGLMTWMQISAMLVFVGAAWNSESATRDE